VSTFRRSARPTATALGVAAVVLVCHAAAWVHAAATPHVTCVEHGESVHLTVAANAETIPTGELVLTSGPTEPAAHGHEHCGLQGPRTTAPAAAPRSSSILRVSVPALPVATVATPALRLLRLAPKTSPPRSLVV
jgi:hypothetical protein